MNTDRTENEVCLRPLNLWLLFEFLEQLLRFQHKRFDDVLAGDLTHRHTVLENHSHAAAKRDPELRVVRFARPIHRTTPDRKRQRLFMVREPAFDLGDNADEVIDVETTASRTRNHSHASRAQPE